MSDDNDNISDYDSDIDDDKTSGEDEGKDGERKDKKKKSKKKKSSSRSRSSSRGDDDASTRSSRSRSKKMKKKKSSRSLADSSQHSTTSKRRKKSSKKSSSSRKLTRSLDTADTGISASSFLSDPESFKEEYSRSDDRVEQAPSSPDRRREFSSKYNKNGSASDVGSYRQSNTEWEMDQSVKEFATGNKRRPPKAMDTRSSDSLDSMTEAMDADRREFLQKRNSARSIDSDTEKTGAGAAGRSMRSLFSRGGSVRSVDRDQAWVERREKRLMMKEKKSLLNYRSEQLRKKILEEGGPRWNFLLAIVTLLTASELGLDLGTTVLSLVSMLSSFTCCGEPVETGSWLTGITIPYSFLVVVEFVILGLSIKQARANTARDNVRFKQLEDIADDEEWFSDEEEGEENKNKKKVGRSAASEQFIEDEKKHNRFHWGETIHYVLLLNPFLGCLIAWFLLYEVADKREAFLILGMEAGAVMLMFVTCYLRRDKMTFNTILINSIPLIPLSVTCAMIWYYLQNGGICYRFGSFSFEGCELCSDRDPTPAIAKRCWNGAIPYDGTYCGQLQEEQFCYYAYT